MELVDLILLVEERGKELAEIGYKKTFYDRPASHYFGSDEKTWVEARVTRVNTMYVGEYQVEDGTIPVVFWPPYDSIRCFSLVLGYVEEVIRTGPLGRRVANKAKSLFYRWLLLLTLDESGEVRVEVRDTEDEPVFNLATRRFECFRTHMNLVDLRGGRANILCRHPELKYVRDDEMMEDVARRAGY